MNKAYDKVVWVNAPSTSSPLNQTNLNKMSDALDTIDDRVIALDSGKVGSVTVTNTLATGTTLATITVDGTATTIKGSDITVDDEMSTLSENPVQNKVIYAELQNLLPEESVTGNPISISDASGLSAKNCAVDFSPIQDLHGQSSPYPAGDSKNKLPLTVAKIKEANNSVAWDGNTYTHQGVTYKIQTDTNNNVIGILATGTASENTSFHIIKTTDSVSFDTDMILSGSPSGGSYSTYGLWGTDSSMAEYGNGTNVSAGSQVYGRIRIASGYAIPTGGILFQPMLRLATISDSAFVPYSNYCPISGWDSLFLEQGAQIQKLIPTNPASITQNGVTIDYVGNGKYHAYGKSTYNGQFYLNIPINEFVIYGGNDSWIYLNNSSSINGISVYFYNGNTEVSNWTLSSVNRKSAYTGMRDNTIDNFSLRLTSSAYDIDIDFTFMVEFVSNDTYETNTATFSPAVMGGKWLPQEGKAVVEWVRVDMGALNWGYGNNVFNVTISDKDDTYLMYCSVYKPTNKSRGELENCELGVYSTGTMNRIAIRDDNYTDANSFKTAVTGQQLCYKLATPIEITLTAEDIELLKGQNVLWSDSNGNIVLTYTADIKTWVLNQLAQLS